MKSDRAWGFFIHRAHKLSIIWGVFRTLSFLLITKEIITSEIKLEITVVKPYLSLKICPKNIAIASLYGAIMYVKIKISSVQKIEDINIGNFILFTILNIIYDTT
jgi:hypothetical protein